MNLRGECLLVILKERMLSQTFEALRNNSILMNAARSSAYFWKRHLKEALGPEGQPVVDGRLDIESDEDWFRHAECLMNGVTYTYFLTARPTGLIAEPYFSRSQNDGLTKFHVYGLRPRPGVEAYYVKVQRLIGVQSRDSGQLYFGPQMETNICRDWALKEVLRMISTHDEVHQVQVGSIDFHYVGNDFPPDLIRRPLEGEEVTSEKVKEIIFMNSTLLYTSGKMVIGVRWSNHIAQDYEILVKSVTIT